MPHVTSAIEKLKHQISNIKSRSLAKGPGQKKPDQHQATIQETPGESAQPTSRQTPDEKQQQNQGEAAEFDQATVQDPPEPGDSISQETADESQQEFQDTPEQRQQRLDDLCKHGLDIALKPEETGAVFFNIPSDSRHAKGEPCLVCDCWEVAMDMHIFATAVETADASPTSRSLKVIDESESKKLGRLTRVCIYPPREPRPDLESDEAGRIVDEFLGVNLERDRDKMEFCFSVRGSTSSSRPLYGEQLFFYSSPPLYGQLFEPFGGHPNGLVSWFKGRLQSIKDRTSNIKKNLDNKQYGSFELDSEQQARVRTVCSPSHIVGFTLDKL
ncbi:hypothetical protein BJ508DRAFT_326346 [Ascobolus immersus RN42]|uniref:Uncharacterized protein n=1 Tax=Ascobolus immersus RN42 TaxID=1160509 RepID=A0A3N4I9U3_ASCIM|nr:hypothetical protein BJ508DRAFT_326346 [Ascobolus immersus RN42]